MKVLKNRIYKHFKGDSYIVLDIVINTAKRQCDFPEATF